MIASLNADKELFMKLLIAQMQNQDPMEPMSNSDMMAQISQLATVESLNSLNASFSDILELARLGNGVDLVGKEVIYEQEGELHSGIVQSVVVRDGDIRLQIGEQQVELEDILTIS